MLFTSLLNRVFGVGGTNNRSITGQAFLAQNFFDKYVGVEDEFLTLLRSGLAGIEQDKVKLST